MKLTGLMLKNWLLLDGTPVQVAAVNNRRIGVHKRRRSIYCSWHLENEFQPIPLTESILVKNGFELGDKMTEVGVHHYHHTVYTIGGLSVEIRKDNTFCFGSIKLIYVHQLQQLLHLCGVEKEIVI